MKKFAHRALSNTDLADSEVERAVSQQLTQHKYGVVLCTLEAQESELSNENYIPDTFKQSLSSLKTASPQMVQATRSIFNQLTHTFDNVLQDWLITVSHLSTSFISAVIEEMHLEMESYFDDVKKNLSEILLSLRDSKILLSACTQPELGGLYSCNATVMALCVSILVALLFHRNSICKFLLLL